MGDDCAVSGRVIEVIQDVTVLEVVPDGSRVAVLLVDEHGIVGRVTYRFASDEAAAVQTKVLQHWCDRGTQLTYVDNAREIALIHEETLFGGALPSPA
jgi:hypothetical protein